MQITYFKLIAFQKNQNFTCNYYNASKYKLHNVLVNCIMLYNSIYMICISSKFRMNRALSSLLFSKLTLSRFCVIMALCSFLLSTSKFSSSWFLVNIALCSSWVVLNKTSLSLVMCNSWCHILSIVLLKYSSSFPSPSRSTLKVLMLCKWSSSWILNQLNLSKISIQRSSNSPFTLED